ncbi:hypothetical protein L227DRAFT_301841 [Lentinus tigrinus ALCF2SS1-6]|uniref:Uncharacterized protein n=2 Tax=Lentinus tigrinus TaxID=5365 RepID=A0A5C2RWU0_9APHY|nr:hypothetical protein L227DRAFT_301841 [Lentinus tigrinus ALCF2SS1-6]
MASIFAHNRILPNLKRRSRSTNKTDVVTPAKAKPLHILPNVAEEDECPSRPSCSSTASLPITNNYQPSRYLAASATLGARPQAAHDKRDSRRVVLTGVEGITFDDFFPPSSAPRARTPSPPPRPITPPRSVASSPASECTLDDINLRFSGLGISLNFPSPPSSATPCLTPSRRREQSPTPSLASSDASSSPKTPCSTPPTSDDESSPCKSNLMRAPTFKSQRASVLFMKSMPDLAEPTRKASITSLVDEDISEEVDYIAQDLSDIVTLSTPLPPASPLSQSSPFSDARARPDSVPPPPRRGRSSKPPPALPRISIQDSSARGPSAQLDPTFPLRRRSYLVPTRPPPPPPVPVPCSPGLSAMEQATEDLLAELANAALGAGFLGTELTVPLDVWSAAGSVPPSPSSHFIVSTPVLGPSGLRPPPRSSIPADINDFQEESPIELELALPKRSDPWPTTPQSISVYSQMSDSSAPASPLSSFDFDIDVTFVSGDPYSHCSPQSQQSQSYYARSNVQVMPESPAPSPSPNPMRRSPSTLSMSADPERTLRSRWSTSTLGSLAESHSHSWLPRFTLSPSKKAKSKAAAAASHSHSHSSSSSSSSPTSPLQRKNAVKGAHAAKRSVDSDRGVSRRDSRSSRVSESSASDSGDSASTTSSGLRRKPIPMALLSVTGGQASMSM